MILRIRSNGLRKLLNSVRGQLVSKRFLSNSSEILPTYPTLPRRHKASSSGGDVPDFRVDHLVVGGGVVGLAITRALAERFPDKSTYLVERHERPGEETSSRNSEVIHAGLYYPPASLKTNLCLRGRDLMYDFCRTHGVPHKQTGKLVVGAASSKDYLEGIVKHVESLHRPDHNNLGAIIAGERHKTPLRIITGDEARTLEPDLGKSVGWTLESARTGIVDSHEFMATLERLALDSECAEIVYDTSVVGIRPAGDALSSSSSSKRGDDGSTQGWIVETQTEGGEVDSILARHVINASGLNAPAMLNALTRDGYFGSSSDTQSYIPMWYSKGNYAAYSKAKGGVDSIQRLIYPLPDMGASNDKHGHQGLGTHLTLDLNGNIRFGPDTDWLAPPSSDAKADWWQQNLVALQPSEATQNKASEEERLDAMFESVTSFLPSIKRDGLSADYAGIRPKLVGPGGGFMDFIVYFHSARHLADQAVRQDAFHIDSAKQNGRKDPRDALFTGSYDVPQPSLISLCGIESPGLTSSLAIAEMVVNLVARRGWALTLNPKHIPKGAQNEEAGYLDQWA